MSQTVTIEYFGVQGSGRTVTEAKRDAGGKIERMLNRTPKVYAYRGHTALVYYHPDGATYVIAHPDSDGQVQMSCHCSANDVERSAISHLFQCARQPGEYDVPGWVPKEFARQMVADWRHHDAFQSAYKMARELGVPDCEAHQWACEHTNEFRKEVA